MRHLLGMSPLTSVEICAGAGGQALGLERAGFAHLACVEIDPHAVTTLRTNRPTWNVIEADLREVDLSRYAGQVDLLAGGVPCPPFSHAGAQLGQADERNLFPTALDLLAKLSPEALMLENVRGLLDERFAGYRAQIEAEIRALGYVPSWALIHARDHGVSQLRPRSVLVALRPEAAAVFTWPTPSPRRPPTLGELLEAQMGSAGWEGAPAWAAAADTIAPTLVGGSKKHGGPDLGPSRAKRAWAALGVNGSSLANEPPAPGFTGMPRLTVAMAALVQGFDPDWVFTGPKTHAYRQVGNAFPPGVAAAVGTQIAAALRNASPAAPARAS